MPPRASGQRRRVKFSLRVVAVRRNGTLGRDQTPESVLVLVELADVVLGVELDAEFGDQIELGFEEIDVLFLVVLNFSNRSRDT